MPRATANGISINFEVEGSGFPLLLIHAWPSDHAIWQLQVPVFSERYQTIAVDLRGLGQSEKPAGRNDPEVMARDMVGLLDALGIERAAVCGISLGGCVAAQMTLDHPSRVASAIWLGAPSYVDKFMIDLGTETIPLVEAYQRVLGPEGYMGFWQKVWKPNIQFLFNREFVDSRLGQHLIASLFEDRYARFNADGRHAMNILDGLSTWSIQDKLAGNTRPVQIIVGDNDPTRSYDEEQARLTRGAEFVLVENSGHFSNLDQATYFNRVALDFLGRTTG
jgi:pimeloyl-ACP methyl ester carboxylesterase